MARLTLARNVAAITLAVWKKGDWFDGNQLNSQIAWTSGECRLVRAAAACGVRVLPAQGFEGEYLSRP